MRPCLWNHTWSASYREEQTRYGHNGAFLNSPLRVLRLALTIPESRNRCIEGGRFTLNAQASGGSRQIYEPLTEFEEHEATRGSESIVLFTRRLRTSLPYFTSKLD
ncbi:hypothetical protein PYCCODRAFT_688959 [Trametes coccinea BRFM310]|uniref:Uncharacterized protein n=1 Tax=Trametes coccinea (strain BRFM310) TaxID=1353009 RepID=A0A1Y2IHB9_TRAC3|nr:hypothetical protein PYCCODRAFT_688959 [Trametes coccinea BRFM310]